MLVAHITNPIGWRMGRVRFFGVGAKWRKVCPTANFLLRYTKKETDGAMAEGTEEANAKERAARAQHRAEMSPEEKEHKRLMGWSSATRHP